MGEREEEEEEEEGALSVVVFFLNRSRRLVRGIIIIIIIVPQPATEKMNILPRPPWASTEFFWPTMRLLIALALAAQGCGWVGPS